MALVGVSSNLEHGGDDGDTLSYDLSIATTGLVSALEIQVAVGLDPNTILVVGSVQITEGTGTVMVGTDPGDDSVELTFDEIESLGVVEITFDVTLNENLPEDLTEISAQATVISTQQPDGILSSDPAQPGDDDPTVFSVTITPGEPVDPPGDTGPGDTWSDDPDNGAGFGTVVPSSNQLIAAPVDVSAEITPPVDTEVESWSAVAFPAGGDSLNGVAS